jgi:signal transduction histidine kinase
MNPTDARRTWLPLLALGVALAAALAFLSLRSQAYDASSYFEDVALLRQMRQLDAQWELDAMKARVGISQSYDALVDPLDSLAHLPQRLSAPGNGSGDGAALARGVAAYQRALRGKVALMEAFKSHNAVLHNSLAFLPVALADVAEAVAEARRQDRRLGYTRAEELLDAAESILQGTLVHAQGGDEGKPAEILPALERLAAIGARWPQPVAARTDSFLLHVRTVLREHTLVNSLLGRIAAAPTGQSIDAIHARLKEGQQHAAQQLGLYRRYLVIFAAALIGLLGYAATRLIRSHAIINRVNRALNEANEHLEQRVRQRTAELSATNRHLSEEIAERKQLQCRLIQSEKLASVGQLAAGMAHEINNPLAFLASNASMLERYVEQLFELLAAHQRAAADPAAQPALLAAQARIDLAYLRDDIPVLLAESRGGMDRVARIVADLKEFAQADREQQWEWADIRGGIDATLSLAAAELQPVADVVCEHGDLPLVECLPRQLNQVLMSLLLNAGQAMAGRARGRITVRTGRAAEQVWLEVQDDGCGIAAEILPRIYDPFFTTRAIGKGAGLGLSLAYGIVRAHQGRIEVESTPGAGTRFRVVLPLRQQPLAEAA